MATKGELIRLLKITAQSYLNEVRCDDKLGEVSVKKEYKICQEIADVLGVTIVSGHVLRAAGYDWCDEYGRYFIYENEGGEDSATILCEEW
jgi:translation initiation factor 6 (eIF-6)